MTDLNLPDARDGSFAPLKVEVRRARRARGHPRAPHGSGSQRRAGLGRDGSDTGRDPGIRLREHECGLLMPSAAAPYLPAACGHAFRSPRATISPGCGANSLRISPPHVPCSNVLCDQAASGSAQCTSSLVVAWAVSAMQRIEDTQSRLPRRLEHLRHMKHTAPLASATALRLQLVALGDKIVIRIDHQKGGDLPVVCQGGQAGIFDMQSLLGCSP
jgi:hypothetical protein